jgi:hypothetical protein
MGEKGEGEKRVGTICQNKSVSKSNTPEKGDDLYQNEI